MTFKEIRKEFLNSGLSLIDVVVADEVYYQFTYVPSSMYEKACGLVKETYLKCEFIDIQALAIALYNLVFEKDKKLEEITKRELVEEASQLF